MNECVVNVQSAKVSNAWNKSHAQKNEVQCITFKNDFIHLQKLASERAAEKLLIVILPLLTNFATPRSF